MTIDQAYTGRLNQILVEIDWLKEIVEGMEARGDRVPFAAEEQIHVIEQIVQEIASIPSRQ